MRGRSGFAVALLALAAGATALGQAPGYALQKQVRVGGDGGWDYLAVDADARRLYVTRSTRVAVYDADSLEPVGEIPDTPGVHGVALAPGLGRGFTSNGRANAVTVFDLKSLKPLAQWKVTGENPDAILFDPFTKRVFTFNGRSANATVFDAATGDVVATVPLGGKPEFATTDLAGRVFVNIEDKSELVALDAQKAEVVHRWPLAPCEEPSGMAIDRKAQTLLIGCGNRMAAIVETASGKLAATVPIGEGVDANAFDPGTGLGFSSNGDGTLTVIGPGTDGRPTALQTVATRRGARTMALDERTHRVFLVTSEFGPAPSPTADQPHPRPPQVPGSFTILVVGR
jgi:DNA-binding beta-propeller fold protein YncE